MGKKLIRHSEAINEIMGTPPSRIVRAGTLTMFIMFVLLILFAWLISYPDTIPTKVEITTTNPPLTLFSKISGHIQSLNVNNNDHVSPGQIMAIMENTASIDEIMKLRNILDTVNILNSSLIPDFTGLGELQEYYSKWRKDFNNLVEYNRNDYYGSKIISVNEEIKATEEYLKRLIVKESLLSENLKIEAGKFRRDSLLFANKVIPESHLELSYQAFLKISIDLQEVRLDQASKAVEIAEKKQLLKDYTIKKVEERALLYSGFEESFLNLKAQMDIWVNKYVLISDIDGIVTFTKFWSQHQFVSKDEPVMNIIPLDAGDFIGRSKLKMLRSGKVTEGQVVNIKLAGYPYLEYGMIKGYVKSKSLVPSGDEYIIEIELTEGLRTLYGIDLEFTQDMQGIAEIITEDVSLLKKLINPFKHLVSKNRHHSFS